ncbi:MAG: inositol monophosphatase family protein [Legionellaceae bacterium]|nr:inositol monophosphatase family protein [Legionellaceae bacterium]
MHPWLNIALNAAKTAGDVLLRNMEHLDRVVITMKEGSDCFSDVDVKAEQAIIQILHKAFPDHSILAEESGLHGQHEDIIWYVDALDGTKNYLHGYPLFSVSIAVKVKQRIEHAVVFDPLRQEFFTASRGQGARLNQRRIRVSKQKSLLAAMVSMGLPSHADPLASTYQHLYSHFIEHDVSLRRSGSAALDLAYLAAGRIDGFVDTQLRPWDIAAGSLLISEAGGLIGDLQGHEQHLVTGNMVAGTPKIFKHLIQTCHQVSDITK